MADPTTPNFLSMADPGAYRQAMALPLEDLERNVEEAVDAMGGASATTPELSRLVGYCEAMLRRLAKEQKAEAGRLTIGHAELRVVRHSMLVGLQSFGEIERLTNLSEVYGDRLPEGMHPLHPSGDAETVSKFAEALFYLELPSK